MTGGTVAGLSADLAILWRTLHQRFGSGTTVTSLRIGPMNIAGEEAPADLLGMAKFAGRGGRDRGGEDDSA